MLDVMAPSLFRPEQWEDLLALEPVKSRIARRRLFFDRPMKADSGDRAIRQMSAAASLTFMLREAP